MNQANRPAKQTLDEAQLQAELTTIACDTCDIDGDLSPSAQSLLDVLADNALVVRYVDGCRANTIAQWCNDKQGAHDQAAHLNKREAQKAAR